jgi:hypothetical protein
VPETARGRDELFAEMIALGESGSEDAMRTWVDGLSAAEKETFHAILTEAAAWFDSFSESMVDKYRAPS